MRIYEITSTEWEEDEYFASERDARKRAADMKRDGEDYRITRVEFHPTKANILSMLNKRPYAYTVETVAEYDPPVRDYDS